MSVCAPVESDDVVHVALPDARATAEHRVAVPSRNVTVPVGTPPLPLPATLAVMVTLWPGVDGLGEEPSAKLAASLLTVCVNVAFAVL